MNKQEFLQRLQASLAALPTEEQVERLAFYSEMIDDRVEEGMTEEEAVAAIGATELPPEAVLQPKQQTWKTVLLLVGSPIWLSLAVVVLVVAISLAAVVLAAIVSVLASAFALIAGGICGAIVGILHLLNGSFPAGLFLLGCACTSAALAIFVTVGGVAAAKSLRRSGKKIHDAVQRRKAEAK